MAGERKKKTKYDKKLTLRQKRFSDEYIVTGDITKSALAAGYSATYARTKAYKLLEIAKIKEYIDRRVATADRKKVANGDEVLEYLTTVMRGESITQSIQSRLIGAGLSEIVPVDKTPDERERLKAAELLGKRYGLFTERYDVDMKLPTIVFDVPTDDEDDA
ncbi:MAG: terminase small subunit [Eubacteriales bacterium]|nr:terminase small subunit [Eubacteriales bacterium]